MKLKIITIFILSVIVFSSCKKIRGCKATDSKGFICLSNYAPVCGCDGSTYSNECIASDYGIKHYTNGACNN